MMDSMYRYKIAQLLTSRFLLALAVLLVTADVLAFDDYASPSASSYVFYTFNISAAVFSAAIITAYREYRWLVYVLFALLLTVNVAGMDGTLINIVGISDFTRRTLPFLLAATVTSFGFAMIALRLESPHWLSRYRKVFYVLAGATIIFTLGVSFWPGVVSTYAMWVVMNILFFVMILSQVLPPLTWPSSGRLQTLFMRIFPFLVCFFVVGLYAAHFSFLNFTQSELNMLNRVLLALFVSFSLILVIWQAFSSANEKEAAERRVLQAARNEAEMQLALAQAEHDYREAHAIASEHRSRLASVSHDLKQPIAALRMAIDHLQRTRSGQQLDKLDRAADYIESLSRAYLSETGANNVEGANEACGDRTKVAVDTRVFAETLRQMFEDDAQQQHIAYKVVCSGHWVNVEPLMAMRAMTNLISNAVMHAQASRILVVFRGQGNKVLFQVFDDGCGMDEQQLEKATLSGCKSETSTGQGLGLEIVQALCHHQDMHFTLRSRPGRGTCATIVIEKSASPDTRDEHGNPQLS